jgi:hypothetical protein
MYKLLITSLLLTGAVFAADQTVTGTVVDAKCAAHGMKDSACAKSCIDKGGEAVLLTDSGDKVWKADNADMLKSHAGEHVQVTAQLSSDNKTMHITDVKKID